jgi:transposase
MSDEVRLGIDVACTAAHQASLADERGVFLWQGWRFRTTTVDLERLWAKLPDDARVVVVMEPTRNAWVPLAAWLEARGAAVSVVPPEQSADLRDYYNKHTKTDRLDSKMLARMPMLHPDGLRRVEGLGPADPFKRAVRHRSGLQKRRVACAMRLDALLELLGPGWLEVFGTNAYGKTAVAVLERYANPVALKKLGRARLTKLVIRASRGAWRETKADEILAAADETLALWAAGGLNFDELAEDIAIEVRQIDALDAEIAALDDRIEAFYETADPAGIVASAPGIGVVLAAGVLARTGDFNRFENLAGIRSFTGLVPKIDQSGTSDHHNGPTKAGDPGLRQALFIAADHARKVDPTLAARYRRLYVDAGKHHNSAICTLAAVLITRIAACWRNGQRYELHDTDGRVITEAEGRKICAERYKIDATTRAARRNGHQPQRTDRGNKESTKAAPATGPSTTEPTENAA